MSTRDDALSQSKRHRRPTVRDVARVAGVSPATVSNVLHYPERVKAGKLRAVQDAIQQLNYIPSESARQLRLGRSRTIGLLLLDAWNPSFADMARGVEDVLSQSNWTLLIGNSSRSSSREANYLNVFEERQVAGIILVPNDPTEFHRSRHSTVRVPVVAMDVVFPRPTLPSVGVDDVAGGEQAIRHLLELGHRRIAFVGDPKEATPIRARLQGVLNLIEQHGSEIDFEVIPTPLTFEGGVRAAETLGQRSVRPTALITAIDLIALGAIQRFQNDGVRVPEDISICGYDDMGLSAALSPPLTTIRRPHYEMGRLAAQLAIGLITETSDLRHSRMLAPELVVRSSTRALGVEP